MSDKEHPLHSLRARQELRRELHLARLRVLAQRKLALARLRAEIEEQHIERAERERAARPFGHSSALSPRQTSATRTVEAAEAVAAAIEGLTPPARNMDEPLSPEATVRSEGSAPDAPPDAGDPEKPTSSPVVTKPRRRQRRSPTPE